MHRTKPLCLQPHSVGRRHKNHQRQTESTSIVAAAVVVIPSPLLPLSKKEGYIFTWVSLSVCLSASWLKNLWMDFDEFFARGGAWPKNQSVRLRFLDRNQDPYLLLPECIQNTESGFPWLSRTFLRAFSRTFHDHLCPFSTSFQDCLIEWISNKSDFHITLNM